MVLIEPAPKREHVEREATIEHLRSRLHPGRREPARGEQRRVLACWKCNNERGRAELLALPLEERRQARSQQRKGD